MDTRHKAKYLKQKICEIKQHLWLCAQPVGSVIGSFRSGSFRLNGCPTFKHQQKETPRGQPIKVVTKSYIIVIINIGFCWKSLLIALGGLGGVFDWCAVKLVYCGNASCMEAIKV